MHLSYLSGVIMLGNFAARPSPPPLPSPSLPPLHWSLGRRPGGEEKKIVYMKQRKRTEAIFLNGVHLSAERDTKGANIFQAGVINSELNAW